MRAVVPNAAVRDRYLAATRVSNPAAIYRLVATDRAASDVNRSGAGVLDSAAVLSGYTVETGRTSEVYCACGCDVEDAEVRNRVALHG